MFRKAQISLLVVTLLAATVTLSHAYPAGDIQIDMRPFWQGYGDVLGCQISDEACWRPRLIEGKTISNYGCTLTSMAMLYHAYGFWWIPNKNHEPYPYSPFIFSLGLNPSTFNNYLAGKDRYGRLLGFRDDNYGFDWYKTTSNFYYYDPVAPYAHYQHIVPNYDCRPFEKEFKTKNGRSASCFMVNWTDAKAMKWLDYDITWGTGWRPPIMKIKYTKYLANGRREPKTHFVVIAGYDRTPDKGDDLGWYRAHNPAFRDNQDNIPKALNGTTQYGMNNGTSYRFDGMDTLYRFTGAYSQNPLDTSRADLGIHSPIEVQVIDPDGNRIGYDPDTGGKLLENPMSLYYEETPVTALDGSGDYSEPYKSLIIIQPRQGNYILKLFGAGDGPYTINMEWTKADGSPNLMTSLTGTATPSLSETYRITYSPTGEASLSQTNQAPVANAGSNQTGEQSYEITLDGSGSSDPDGDPLKYTWSFVARPPNSAAVLSDANAMNPSFTPDKTSTSIKM